MKRVIEGRVYSTETAEMVYDWDNGCYTDDFNYCSETLYRTKKGSFFLYGEGGAMSCYGRSVGRNEWSGGETLRPLTADQAFRWLEEHSKAEIILKQFPERVTEA
jgi:hypothetical protein